MHIDVRVKDLKKLFIEYGELYMLRLEWFFFVLPYFDVNCNLLQEKTHDNTECIY